MSKMDEERIRQCFEAVSRFKLSDDVTARDLKRVKQRLTEYTSKQKTEHRDIWRTIMKSKITKIAAAAVITVAAILALQNGSVDIAAPAFAEMIEAMKKMPWMHQISKGFERGVEGTAEQWVSFESKVWIGKNYDGTVVYFDYEKHSNYTYDPNSNTVTISYLHQDKPSLELSSPWSVLEKILEALTEQGAEITQKQGEYRGKTVQIQEVSLTTVNNEDQKLHLFVDPRSHLLLAGKVKATDADGNVVMDGDIKFEYPEKGPRDIYDLGVPRSATIVNNLPPLNVSEVLANYRSFRERGPDRYIAILTTMYANSERAISSPLKITYRNGDLMKTEHRRAKRKKYESWKEYSSKRGTNFNSLSTWWTNNDNSELTEVYLYDGKYDYYVYGLANDLKSYQTEGHNPNHKGLNDIGWPNISRWIASDRELRIVETDYSKSNNLICIELLFQGWVDPGGKHVSLPMKSLYYLNPERGYICVRKENYSQRHAPWQKDNSWLKDVDLKTIPSDEYSINEVAEFAQTNTGQWYPKKIETIWCNDASKARQRQSTRTIYLKTNPKFPKVIFDPNNLPKEDQ